MKVKTAELDGLALDWAVAKCEDKNGVLHDDGITRCIVIAAPSGVYKGRYTPTVNWAQGGPIIERENISVGYQGHLGVPLDSLWYATNRVDVCGFGQTPLIAALRCFCLEQHGDEIEVPDAALAGHVAPPAALVLPEDEHGKFWYVRTNVETGAETRECFTPTQSPVFGDAKGVSRAALLQAMESCIKTWNRQMPNQYRYRLATASSTLTERA